MAVSVATNLRPAHVWWSAVRPATLAASIAPVLAGTAIALDMGAVRWAAGIGALAVGIAMQLGVNFANDYSDFVRGADRVRTGPVRAASSGVIAPAHVRAAAVAAFAVAAAVGLVLSAATDWRLVVAGLACLLAGWLYTGGPRPYGYLGLGELFVFIFFGLVATLGTVYVEALRVSVLAVAFACAMGFLACAILVLNNLRDIDTDAAAGKRTLATRIGRRQTRWFLTILVAFAFLVPLLAPALGLARGSVWLTLPAAGVAAASLRLAWTSTSPGDHVRALKLMAATELVYALLLALGLLL